MTGGEQQPDDLVTKLGRILDEADSTCHSPTCRGWAEHLAEVALASGLVLPAADVIPRSDHAKVVRVLGDVVTELEDAKVEWDGAVWREGRYEERLDALREDRDRLAADVIPKQAVLDLADIWEASGTKLIHRELRALVAGGES